MSLEQYGNIDGYGDYTVSSWGNVYKVTSKMKYIMPGTTTIEHYLKKVKPEKTSKGYLRVPLYKDGKRKWHKVHRLVANAFIPNPDNKPQVNHKDGNKLNNSITNLEWVTDEENKEHYKQITDKEKPYE